MFDPYLPETIFSDYMKLNHILMNLVSNAVKFTPNGKKILMAATREENHLVLHVILVAEDNRFNQESMAGFLKGAGLKHHLAEDGEACVQLAKSLHPDVILMDIKMPKKDGLTAMREIGAVEKLRDIPIIALSANAFLEQQQVAFEAGATGYLVKVSAVDRGRTE